jgi:hypothetical protein
MRKEGHAKIILDHLSGHDDKNRCVSRTDYIEEVKVLMKEARGRELPGTYNPLIVAELFSKQSKPWKGLICCLSDHVLDCAYTSVTTALQYTADEETAASLLHELIGPSMESLKESLAIKVMEILEPHSSGHPITYNHYLTENVQKAQATRNRHELEKRLKAFFDSKEISQMTTSHYFSMKSLLDNLVFYTEPDMDKFSCSIATDMMQAYYKVSSFFLLCNIN